MIIHDQDFVIFLYQEKYRCCQQHTVRNPWFKVQSAAFRYAAVLASTSDFSTRTAFSSGSKTWLNEAPKEDEG